MIKQLLKKYKKHFQIAGIVVFALGYLFTISSRPPATPRSTSLVTPKTTPTQGSQVDSKTAPASDSYNYNQEFDKLIKQYPWYPSLPLETTDYRVIFDFEKNQFRIRILNLTTTNKQEIVNTALSDMEKIGINNTQFKHYILP